MKAKWFGMGLIALIAVCLAASPVSAATKLSTDVPPGTAVLVPKDPSLGQFQGDNSNYDMLDAYAYFYGVVHGPKCTAEIGYIDDTAVSPIQDLAGMIADSRDFDPGPAPANLVAYHATVGASLISAGISNGLGIPGWSTCPLVWAKITGSADSNWDQHFVDAVNWEASRPNLRVIVIPLDEAPGWTDQFGVVAAITNAAVNAHKLVFVSGGNRNQLDPNNDPLAARLAGIPGVLRVGGADAPGALSIGSNYGPLIDLACPFTMPADRTDGNAYGEGGNSISTPICGAIAGEMFTFGPLQSNVDVANKMISTASQGSQPGGTIPIVNAFAAIKAAGYQPPPPASLKVKLIGKGSVDSDQGDIACGDGGSCSATQLAPDSEETLTATATKGWKFSHWSGACSGTKLSCHLTLKSGPNAASAWFVARAKTQIKVSVVGQGMVIGSGVRCGSGECRYPSVSGSQSFTRTYRVFAHAKWKFSHWTGACHGTVPRCDLKIAPNKQYQFGAVFVRVH